MIFNTNDLEVAPPHTRGVMLLIVALKMSTIHFWPHIFGYFFAVFISDFFVRHIVSDLWKDLGATKRHKDPIRPSSLHPQIVGLIERFLYVSSILIGVPEFIGIWLAIKVGGQWKRWSEGTSVEGNRVVAGREIFNVFLIGNGLSITYSIIGAKSIGWLISSEFKLGFGAPALICILVSILWLFIRLRINDSKAYQYP